MDDRPAETAMLAAASAVSTALSHRLKAAAMDGTKPRMSDLEVAAFSSFARSATSYFEFGIGGSTDEAGRLVTGRVVAIDSDAAEEFGRIVREIDDISFFVRRHDMNMIGLEEVLHSYSSDPQ